MTSKPLSDDEVEICRLLHEKDNDPLEALSLPEIKLLRKLDEIVTLRCDFLLKIIQKSMCLELMFERFDFGDKDKFKVSVKQKGIITNGFWIFSNYYLTLNENELEPQLIKEGYLSN